MMPRWFAVSAAPKWLPARVVVPLVSAFVLFVSLAVAAHRPEKDDGPAAPLSKAPRAASSLRNPFTGQAEAVAAGRKLFVEHCAQCHGPEGRGMERAADLHSPVIQNAPSGVLFWALRNGRIRRGMPSWSALPDQRLWQIVAYL